MCILCERAGVPSALELLHLKGFRDVSARMSVMLGVQEVGGSNPLARPFSLETQSGASPQLAAIPSSPLALDSPDDMLGNTTAIPLSDTTRPIEDDLEGPTNERTEQGDPSRTLVMASAQGAARSAG